MSSFWARQLDPKIDFFTMVLVSIPLNISYVTAVQLVLNPFSQLVPQLELYYQLQLSLWSDPIALGVPNSR